jgi:hypothetical protein
VNETKAILCIIAGSAAIFAGFTVKQFYAATGGNRFGPPVARWKGRLLCVVVGAMFLFFGFKYLFFDVYK